jgi:hypothetical protein
VIDDKDGERLAKPLADPDRAQRVESIGEGMREAESTDEMQPIPCGFGQLPNLAVCRHGHQSLPDAENVAWQGNPPS